MFGAIMTNWFTDYHAMLLLRMLTIVVVFGVAGPGLWLLLRMGFRSARHLAGRMWQGAHTLQDHSP